MALTQVVEHHLPTYASLAFVEQKWECKKNLNENQKKMKMHRAENATQHTSFIIECCNIGMYQRREANFRILSWFRCNPC